MQQLKTILRSIIKLALEDRGQMHILLNRAGVFDTDFDESYHILLERIEAAIKHGMKLGSVRDCGSQFAAHCALAQSRKSSI